MGRNLQLSPRHFAAFALAAMWLVAFWGVWWGDGAFFYRDQLLTALPLRAYLTERLRTGELPQWYPYEALGVPFIGQIVTATFHPFSLLLLPFDPVSAVKAQTLLAYLLAMVGGYRAARAFRASRTGALISAAALGLGGYGLGISHNPVYLTAHATLPWVLAAMARLCQTNAARHVALLAAAAALVLLAGDAQGFACCGLLFLATASLAERPVLAPLLCAVAGGLAAALCAAELWPALLLARHSIRVAGSTDPMLGRIFSFHPLRLAELWAPGLLPNELRVEVTSPLFHDGGALWSTTVFAGASVCILALVALICRRPHALGLGALLIIGLLLAMGSRGGLLPLLWKVATPLTAFRFPEKYASLAFVALGPLAALGFDAALERRRAGVVTALGAGGALAVLMLATRLGNLHTWIFRAQDEGRVPSDAVLAAVRDAWTQGFGRAAAVAAVVALLLWADAGRMAIARLLPLLVFVELTAGNVAHAPTVPRALLDAKVPFAEIVRTRAAREGLAARAITVAGGRAKRTVTGDDPRWAEVMRSLLRADESGRSHVGSLFFNLPATTTRAWRALGPNASLAADRGPLFGGCFAVGDTRKPLAGGAQSLSTDERLELALYRLPCRPRAYLGAATPVGDLNGATAALRQGLPGNGSVWEGGPALGGSKGTVGILRDVPEELGLTIRTGGPTALVVNNLFLDGWSAELDGKPVPLFAANVAARGVAVAAGSHQVTMRYATPGLLPGLGLSALAVAVTVTLARRRGRRRASTLTWPRKWPAS